MRFRSGLLVVMASALIIGACAAADTAASVLGPTTTITSFAGTTTTTSVSVYAWSRVPHDEEVLEGPGHQEMTGVTVGGPGLVAVGFDGPLEDVDAAVWTSPNGITWSRVPDSEGVLGGAGYQQMNSVTLGGPGLVAVGSDGALTGQHAVVWTSPDGITWSKETIDGEVGASMTSVTVGGPGLVAVGIAGDFDDAAVWTSPDGVSWSRVPHDEAIFGGTDVQVMSSVAVGGPGLVAVGQDGPHEDVDAAVWTSTDGTTWSRVPDSEGVLGGAGHQEMTGVTVGGPGLVAVGFDGPLEDVDAAVWTSPDGITWSRVPDNGDVLGGPSIQWMSSVAQGGPGLVAVGIDLRFLLSGDGSHAPVWTSPDGIIWSQETIDGEVGGSINGVTVGGPGLVAVGLACCDDDLVEYAAVWLAASED